MNANKRPSPEPLEVNAEASFVAGGVGVGVGGVIVSGVGGVGSIAAARISAQAPPKKAKVTAQKKKKRRDPHEPQK